MHPKKNPPSTTPIADETTPERRPSPRPCADGSGILDSHDQRGMAVRAVGAAASAEAEGHRYAIQPEASELTFNATSRCMNALGRFLRLSGEVLADPADLS